MTYKIIRVRGEFMVEFHDPRHYNDTWQMNRTDLLDLISNLEWQHMSTETELKALAELNARVKQENNGG